MDTSALGGSGIQIEIRGRDLDVLQDKEKYCSPYINYRWNYKCIRWIRRCKTEFRIVINKEEAASYNLTVQVFIELNAILRERTPQLHYLQIPMTME